MSLYSVIQNPNDAVVSTTVRMLINGVFIGVIQSLSPSQNRSTTAVRGIGIGDRQIERVWNLSEYTLSVQKIALYKKFMFNALGYDINFRMIAELRYPIDIQETILKPDGTGDAMTTFYRGCYMNRFSSQRTISGDIIIMEDVDFDCTSIDRGEGSVLDYETGV